MYKIIKAIKNRECYQRIESKFCNTIIIKIKNQMHKKLEVNHLGTELWNHGEIYCEFGESKIINYNNVTRLI